MASSSRTPGRQSGRFRSAAFADSGCGLAGRPGRRATMVHSTSAAATPPQMQCRNTPRNRPRANSDLASAITRRRSVPVRSPERGGHTGGAKATGDKGEGAGEAVGAARAERRAAVGALVVVQVALRTARAVGDGSHGAVQQRRLVASAAEVLDHKRRQHLLHTSVGSPCSILRAAAQKLVLHTRTCSM